VFKRAILSFCAVALLSVGGFETTNSADAAWRSDIRRFSRNVDRTHRQLDRSWDRERNYNNRRYGNYHGNSYYNRGYNGRNDFYGRNRGYNNGFISTPYFSIGF
jgi:hypothetical protein